MIHCPAVLPLFDPSHGTQSIKGIASLNLTFSVDRIAHGGSNRVKSSLAEETGSPSEKSQGGSSTGGVGYLHCHVADNVHHVSASDLVHKEGIPSFRQVT
jgi:hypothetical protein